MKIKPAKKEARKNLARYYREGDRTLFALSPLKTIVTSETKTWPEIEKRFSKMSGKTFKPYVFKEALRSWFIRNPPKRMNSEAFLILREIQSDLLAEREKGPIKL